MYGDARLYISKPSEWNTGSDEPGKAKLYVHIKNNTATSLNLADLSVRFWTAETYDFNRYSFEFKSALTKCYTSSSAVSQIIPANTWSGTTVDFMTNGIENIGPSKEAIKLCNIYNQYDYTIPPNGFLGLTDDLSSCLELEYRVYGNAGFRRPNSWYSVEPSNIGIFQPAANYALYSAGHIIDGFEPSYHNSRLNYIDSYVLSELNPSALSTELTISNGIGYREHLTLRFPFSAYGDRDIGRAILYIKSTSDVNDGSNKDISLHAIDSGYSSSSGWNSQPSYGSAISTCQSAYNSSIVLPFSHAFDITSYASTAALSGYGYVDLLLKYSYSSTPYYNTRFSDPYIIIDSFDTSTSHIDTDKVTVVRTNKDIATDHIITGRTTRHIVVDQEVYTFGGTKKELKTSQMISGILYDSIITDMVIGADNSIHYIKTDSVISPKGGRLLKTNQHTVSRPYKIIYTDSYIVQSNKGSILTDLYIRSSIARSLLTDVVVAGTERNSIHTDACVGFPVKIDIPVPERKRPTYSTAALYAKDIGWEYNNVTDLQSVKQSLEAIMRTPKGSLIRRPQDGVSIYDEVLTVATPAKLTKMLSDSIKEISSMDGRISIDGSMSSIRFDTQSRQITIVLVWSVYGGRAANSSTFIINK